MKKNIAYYLEDPERLSEISLLELNQWVEEMPYSQPLRLLVDMKSEKNTSDVDKDNDSYCVYFAQDYEPLSKKETKILAEKNINKAINEDQLVPVVPIPNKDAIVGNSKEGSMEAAVEVPPIVTHSLVDDVSEDTLEDDLLEINPNVVVVNEVSHEEADEVLEAELENEVLEISLEEVEEVTSFSALDSMLDTDKVAGVEYEEDVDDNESESENTEGDRYAGLVDYKSFVVGVSAEDVKGDEFEVDEIEEDIIAEVDAQPETKELEKELIVTHSESYETTVLVDSPQKTKKEKKSKKKDKKNKKKKASKKKEKTKKEEKKKKSKAKKSSDKEKIKVKTKKKSNSKELKSSKNKTSSIKKVKGEITNPDLALKSKSVKGKAKKIKKEVKYVVVNEATTNDFKLNIRVLFPITLTIIALTLSSHIKYRIPCRFR